MAVQSGVGSGLVGVDVQTGGPDLAGLQSSQQGILVHVGTTGGVDDDHAVLHLGDGIGVDEGSARCGGSVEGDEVGLGQQFLQRHIGDAKFGLHLRTAGGAVSDDVHADGLCHDAQMLADAAEADDAERLALKLDALAVGLLFPLILTHGVAGDGDIAGAGEHVAHSQLRHGLGGGAGGVADGNAVLLGVLDVNVVNAHAAADDQLELAALGLVDLCRADLGLGADHHGVEVTQGSAQLVGLVELLDDLVTQLAQLRHRGLIHTVSNKNTHGNNLLR